MPLGPVAFRLSMAVTLFVNRTGQWTKCCSCLWHMFWCRMPSLFIELAREILETLLDEYLHWPSCFHTTLDDLDLLWRFWLFFSVSHTRLSWKFVCVLHTWTSGFLSKVTSGGAKSLYDCYTHGQIYRQNLLLTLVCICGRSLVCFLPLQKPQRKRFLGYCLILECAW